MEALETAYRKKSQEAVVLFPAELDSEGESSPITDCPD
jgi:hypothetical protein